MPRITTVQAAHNYGVLDPHVIERRDTKFIGGSLSDGRNIVLLPQGGYTDRGGTTDHGRVRRAIEAVSIDGTILSLPNGGSESDLLAGIAITTAAASTTRFVLFECDFGAATLVHMIDIAGVSIATTAADNALVAEYWDGAAWQAFAPALKIETGSYSRRFASGAPGHAGFAATKFRVCVDATTAAGAVTFSGIALWTETAAMVDAIVRAYAPEQGMAHQLVYSPHNIDVYEAGIWRASVATPITAAQLRLVKLEPKYDTILAFEQTLHPLDIKRLGISTEWSCGPVAFENLPLVDYGAIYTNGVNEVQEIQLYGMSDGDTFELLFEGLATTAIERSSTTPPFTAANIKSALDGLANVGTGLTVTADGNNRYRITFGDTINANKNVLTMGATVLSGGGASTKYIRVRTITEGKPAGEPIMSDLRGWPAVGRYAQQRLIMGGLKSRPNDVLASVTGDPFNLNMDIDVATKAFSYEVDTSGNSVIRDIFVGRALMFYGDQQLAFLKNNVLSASEVPQFGASDTPGIKAQTSPVSSDNAIFHVQSGGTTLRMTSYTELEQNFVAENASVLSAHLIRNPTDLFRRRAVGAVDSDLMMMVNSDGTMTVETLMRTQDVSGFAPWETDGYFRSGCSDQNNVVWVLVERQIGGAAELRLEKMEPDKLLDGAIEISQASSATIAGLSIFNGRTVYVVANDSVYGPHAVSGGTITIDEPVTEARIGTWVPPSATDPEVSLTEETRARMARLKRVNRVEVSVLETTSIAIRANDGEIVDMALHANDETMLDQGPLATPVTGKLEAEGMHGFTDHGKVTITQVAPGKLTVRSLTKNIAA